MKKYRLRLVTYFLIFFGILGILSFTCAGMWKQIYQNKKEVKELTIQYEKLKQNEDNLETEVVRLRDPEYVAKYAREKYKYSKDGEIIIDLNDLDDED